MTMPSSMRMAAGISRATAFSRCTASSSLPGSPRMMATAADVSTTKLLRANSVNAAGRVADFYLGLATSRVPGVGAVPDLMLDRGLGRRTGIE